MRPITDERYIFTDRVKNLIREARAKERERCAQVAEHEWANSLEHYNIQIAKGIAAAIRALKDET